MIELTRIVDKKNLYAYRATKNQDLAVQLEQLIRATTPKNNFPQWHPFISDSFIYNPPHPEARFRPPFGKNIFYGSLIEETALYEHAFHFMKQRVHLNITVENGDRTIFFVDADNKSSVNIKNDRNFTNIMDKKNYSASHQFISSNPSVTFIEYPSVRDPQQRENVAILDISCLSKNPKWSSSIKYFYDNTKKQITWIDYQLDIQWSVVA